MICSCCGQKVNTSSKREGNQIKKKMLKRIEKITEKDASLKGFWAETTKITELKDCKHSLAPVLKSKRLTTKGIIF